MYLSQGRESQSLGYRGAGKFEREPLNLPRSGEDSYCALGPRLEVCPRNGHYRTTLTSLRAYRNSLWGYRFLGALHRSQIRYEGQGFSFPLHRLNGGKPHEDVPLSYRFAKKWQSVI